MVIEARGFCPFQILRLSPSGERDQDDRSGLQAGAYSLRHLVAIHARHANVEYRHMRTYGGDDAERLRPIVSHADLMAIHL